MPTNSKLSPKDSPMAAKKPSGNNSTLNNRVMLPMRQKVIDFMKRRPHRSFRRTAKRDYKRSLKLPGYWSFTESVRKTVWIHRKLLILLTLTYVVLMAVMVGIGSQDNYTTLQNTIKDTSGNTFSSGFGVLSKAGLLFLTTATGGISQSPTEAQQIYTVLAGLLAWLTTVWLLRNVLAGHKVKLRDGLYSSGAPILATFVVCLVFIVQLIPLALALIGYSAAQSSGLLSGGVEAMLFWAVAGLLSLLSAYWVTSTFLALVIVTLPGMYPFRALKIAGDLVIGRRLRILLRIIWLLLGVGLAWVLVMIPIILIDTWIKDIWPAVQWLPIVPVSLLVISSMTVVWIASYVYLLYRRIVADDSDAA